MSASIDDVVRQVGIWKGLDAAVSPLSGGLTYDNYLAEAHGTRYVLRVPGATTAVLAIDRENELHNARAAAEVGIGPRVLDHVPGLDAMVLEYIDGTTMSGASLRSPELARRMADLLAENYIDDGATLWIVDYEYSGNNDPAFELANTAQECEFDDDLRALLCQEYFGTVSDRLLARMALHALMSDLGWTLWAVIEEGVSEIDYDFQAWADLRWDRARAILGAPRFRTLLETVA